MTDDRFELVNRALDAINTADLEAVRTISTEDVELNDLESLPDSGVYRGVDEFVGWVKNAHETFEKIRFEASNPEPVGTDQVVTDVHVTASGLGSGIEADMDFAALWRFRDDRIAFHKGFTTRERALAAARGELDEEPN